MDYYENYDKAGWDRPPERKPEREPSTVFYAWHVIEEKSGTYAILRMKGDRKVLKPLEKIGEICGLSKEGVELFFKRELAF